MSSLVVCGLINAAIASLLALGALLATWRWRNPYLIRAIWLVVLLRFVVPPIFTVHLPWLTDSVHGQMNSTKVANSPGQPFARQTSPTTNPTAVTPGQIATTTVQTSSTDSRAASPQTEPRFGGLSRTESTPFAIASVWLLGAVFISALVLQRIWKFDRLIRKTKAAPKSLQRQVNQVAARIGVSRPVHVHVTDSGTPPLVWCLGKHPTIVLPSSFMDLLEETQTTSILAHEVMHVHRNDSWCRWLEVLAVSLYWWCPFSWTARRMLQDAEERCCDADVLNCFPELRKSYASALLATLDLLAGADRLGFAGTGFASSSSMKRRFEMIVCPQTRGRPATSTRILMTAAAVALLAATPVVSSSATPPESATQGVAQAQPNSLELKHDNPSEGQTTVLSNDRIAMPRDHQESSLETKPEKSKLYEASNIWSLSLAECFKNALVNDSEIQVASEANGALLIAPKSTSDLNDLDFHGMVRNKIRDLEDSYWTTWQAFRNLETQRAGRDRALETWRQVTKLQRSGSTGGEADKEVQARATYFSYRSQVESALTDLVRIENRLRYMMGLTSSTERLIRPSDQPTAARVQFDWQTANQEALSNRAALARQDRQVKRRQLELEMLQKQIATQRKKADQQVDPLGYTSLQHPSKYSRSWIHERKMNSAVRHHELLLAREQAVQADMKLEVSHQLSDSLRDVDQCYELTQTNQSRSKVAQEACKSVEAVYDSGRVTLDLLIDGQRRATEAREAYDQARTDYVRAISRLHYKKGTLLAQHGISVKQTK